MEEISTKMLVIGGGPGGYVAAVRAGQLGVDTVLIERADLGGTCLNIGCIPSKALIHVADAFHEACLQENTNSFGLTVTNPKIDFTRAMTWKDGIVSRLTGGIGFLLKKARVNVLAGRAQLADGKSCVVSLSDRTVRVRAQHVVVATGSEPMELKTLPFGGSVLSSTEVLSLDAIPKTLVVIGAGYIGLELGIAFAKLGSAVTLVEAADRILPTWDSDLTRPVAKKLSGLGLKVMTGALAQGLSPDGETVLVQQSGASEAIRLPADKILVAVGRKARTAGFGLEKLDLRMQGHFIEIDSHCGTSMRDVWAVGDVTGEPMLAHRAMAQGAMVAEIIAGRRRVFDNVAMPAVCFSDPEVVSVGLLPSEAKSAGYDVLVGQFPFVANGRSMTQHSDAGFVRIVARADNHLVLGVQAVGSGVAELSSAFGLALEMGATLEDVAATIQAHPTRGEAFQESSLDALGRAVHC